MKVVDVDGPDLRAGLGIASLASLDGALALHVHSAIDASLASSWAEGVRSARAAWVSDFDGAQFSLGRAWYTHLEQNRADAYFRDVQGSDARVEEACPGLARTMRGFVERLAGAPAFQRSGWCGPGVHVFPAGAHVAKQGGDIHFDTEGLTPVHARERAPSFTMVLMLAPPERAGGLRVWDVRYADTDAYEDEDLDRPSAVCEYAAGDLVVIDSYRLHQIQPFPGTRDRISATCHAAFVAGQWETWF
ncbi:hypothetical protein AKJ09_00985 [Labilithrix luteola]|uniref:Prolyl 4-hydroxylase alpha subunit Fe(2+) 2OG dioxygenase domain-containing protein n=1 Tax=Labilithrix luteola TaxID=1391654 RepID=A0A0K1PLQ2_9BACT|nr:hypothetical protein [Labilithrix luteola]AKU94321.1 hypothetical protein AKJ09_00985 [Labilithrix luteola]